MNTLYVLIACENSEETERIISVTNGLSPCCETIRARSLEETAEITSGKKFDYVFLDYDFINDAGDEILDLLKSQNFQGKTIVISNCEKVETVVRCMRKGATDFLPRKRLNKESIEAGMEAVKDKSKNQLEKVLLENKKHSHELEYKNIIAKSPISIFKILDDGTICLYKGPADHPVPLQSEPVAGRSLREMEDNLPVRFSDFEKACSGTEYEFTTKVGERHFEVHYIPVLDDNRKIKEMMGIAIDITSFKENEQKLIKTIVTEETSRKIKEQFIANMSHEIRTPIHGIISLTEFLLQTAHTGEQNNYLQLIKKSADTLLVIINDILDLSKLEAGKMNLEKIPFNIPDTIHTAIASLIPKATEKNIQLKTNLLGIKNEHVEGDPVRLTQIINNLIGNAIKFTEKGYAGISVTEKRLSKHNSEFEFIIEDTGIGIPPDRIDKIFDDFTQGGDDISRRYGGTGLGLGITRSLIRMHNGQISVSSMPGKGTRFVLTIPYEVVEKRNETYQQAEGLKTELPEGLRVLIAEDHDINRFIINKMLSEWKIKADCVSTGAEAVNAVHSSNYDLILMDIEMPEMNGYEATRRIRSNPEKRISGIPIIAMTGHAMVGEREKCLEYGMNDYISKPFKPENLKTVIGEWHSGNAPQSYKHPTHVMKNTQSGIQPAKATASHLTNSHPGIGKDTSGPYPGATVNLDFLREISDNNEDFFKQFIQLFLANTPASLAYIQEGIIENNWEKIRQSAHKIKPSFNYVGLKELSSISGQIEEWAKNKENMTKISEQFHYLKASCESVFVELEKEIKTPAN